MMVTVLLFCAAQGAQLEQVIVSADGAGFLEKDSGKPYIPFGTNYFDPHVGWAPKLWKQFDEKAVRQHFQLMQELGVNCARIFLTAASFQPTPDKVEEEVLEKLDSVVAIARETEIRLILTGPDHWEGSPDYWRPDRYAGEQALQALEHLWGVLGKRYRGEGAIFAWDLLNEPHMPWFVEQWRGRWNDWLKDKYNTWEALKGEWGDELGEKDVWGNVSIPEDKPDEGNPRLLDWQLFREHLADEWVRRQTEAIRRADPTHLVTVGYIQWSYPLVRPGNPSRYAAFNPHRQAKWCDFMTIHFYPTMGSPFASEENWQNNLDYLRSVLAYCQLGKPVVLGEYGWYGGGAPQNHPHLSEQQQADWLSAEIEASRGLANGWLSWPFADTPTSRDISLYAGLVKDDFAVKVWGRKFRQYAGDVSRLKREVLSPVAFYPGVALTATDAELGRMHRRFVEKIKPAEIFEGTSGTTQTGNKH